MAGICSIRYCVEVSNMAISTRPCFRDCSLGLTQILGGLAGVSTRGAVLCSAFHTRADSCGTICVTWGAVWRLGIEGFRSILTQSSQILYLVSPDTGGGLGVPPVRFCDTVTSISMDTVVKSLHIWVESLGSRHI